MDWKLIWNNNKFKNVITSKSFSRHIECSYVKLAEVLLSNVRSLLVQDPKTVKKFCFFKHLFFLKMLLGTRRKYFRQPWQFFLAQKSKQFSREIQNYSWSYDSSRTNVFGSVDNLRKLFRQQSDKRLQKSENEFEKVTISEKDLPQTVYLDKL